MNSKGEWSEACMCKGKGSCNTPKEHMRLIHNAMRASDDPEAHVTRMNWSSIV